MHRISSPYTYKGENNAIKQRSPSSRKKIHKQRTHSKQPAKGIQKSGREHLLEGIYQRTAELIQDNQSASKALMAHLQQILPSIALYEALLKEEGSQEKALATFEKWCFIKIEKMAKLIPVVMKIPGLYKMVPGIMKLLLDKTFGHAAGFDYIEKELENGFAADMTVCPYVETCKKYGCPELAQFFCKSDDICYGNMHPKLVWGRTKTLGTGGDCCDFSLWIKEEL